MGFLPEGSYGTCSDQKGKRKCRHNSLVGDGFTGVLGKEKAASGRSPVRGRQGLCIPLEDRKPCSRPGCAAGRESGSHPVFLTGECARVQLPARRDSLDVKREEEVRPAGDQHAPEDGELTMGSLRLVLDLRELRRHTGSFLCMAWWRWDGEADSAWVALVSPRIPIDNRPQRTFHPGTSSSRGAGGLAQEGPERGGTAGGRLRGSGSGCVAAPAARCALVLLDAGMSMAELQAADLRRTSGLSSWLWPWAR